MSKKKKRDTSLPSDAELLTELATVDEVSAYIPTNMDHDAGVVPSWCELVLDVRREPMEGDDPWAPPGHSHIRQKWMLRRHDGELLIQVLHDVLHPNVGVGLDHVWSMLDDAVERIQKRVSKGKPPRPADQAEALTLATAIAHVAKPHDPDVDDVKATAMARFEIRHGISGVGSSD